MIPLAKPYVGENTQRYLNKIIESGRYTQGKFVEAFEFRLTQECGGAYAVALNSGTSALELALRVKGIGPGCSVLVPAFSWVATASAVVAVGATPIFMDIELDTWGMDQDQAIEFADDIARGMSYLPPVKAIIPVHIFGIPSRIQRLRSYCDTHKIALIEDAACALGGTVTGLAPPGLKNYMPAGTLGDIGMLSFHPRKIITTGEGGALITKDRNLRDELMELRNHGLVGTDVQYAGHNMRMSEFQAAVGLAQLEQFGYIFTDREETCRMYDRRLEDVNYVEVIPKSFDHGIPAPQAYVIRFNYASSSLRDFFIPYMKDHGVEVQVGTQYIPGLSYYRKVPWDLECPNAKLIASSTMALPLYIGMGQEEVDYVVKVLKEGIKVAGY